MRLITLLCFIIPLSAYATESFSRKIFLKNADFKMINEKLSLQLKFDPLNKASGYYHTAKGVLNGKFDLGEEYTGHNVEQDAFYLYKNRVKGSFHKGKKSGKWTYSYVFDDGLQIFERHDIIIKFKNGKCIESQFDGVIGHIMPITKQKFNHAKFCTPSDIRAKAWEQWVRKYNKTR